MHRFFSVLVFCLWSAGAWGQPLPVDQCAEVAAQESCQATCAVACADLDFLGRNIGFCSLYGIHGGQAGAVVPGTIDGEACLVALAGETETGEMLSEEDANTVQEDCLALPTLLQQEACLLRAVAPPCEPRGFPRLQARADVLIGQIDGELAQYGDLLDFDWTTIEDTEALCAFTIEELDANYAVAVEDPDRLEALLGRAREIQDCASDWNTFVRKNADPILNDGLVDNAATAAANQLSSVRETIQNLRASADALRGAADQIRSTARAYLRFCDVNAGE